MRSPKYELVKRMYDEGTWNKARVRNAVIKGWITEEEYSYIINGEPDPELEAPDNGEPAEEQPEGEAEPEGEE